MAEGQKGAALTKALRLLLYALIAAGTAASLSVGFIRAASERLNRTVGLVADYQQVEQLAADAGTPLPILLKALRQAGITGIAVTEDTIQSLRDAGEIEVRRVTRPTGTCLEILFLNPDPRLRARVHGYLRQQLPLVGRSPSLLQRSLVLPSPIGYEQVRNVGVGLPEGDVREIQASGMYVVGRIANFTGAAAETVGWKLEELRTKGVPIVVFVGEEVLGYRALLPAAADYLSRGAPLYGSVEFAKQRGDDGLTRLLRGRYIRVHSITPQEAARMSPSEMIERYARAVEERNIRLCFVRLLPFATTNTLADQVSYVEGVRDALQRTGFTMGQPVPFAELAVSLPVRVLCAVGAVSAFFLLLYLLIPVPALWAWVLFIAGAVLDVVLLIAVPGPARKYLALKSALVFPTLAVLLPYARARTGTWGGAKAALGALFWVSGISIVGAAHVVGLLSDRSFMVKAQQFAGIKLAHLLPLLAIAVICTLDWVNDGRPWQRLWADIRARARAAASSPILMWQALALALAAAALLLLLIRTGNEAGAVSAPELKLRSLLDQVLIVRPRTKEFLIGHPALFVALALLPVAGRNLWAPLLVLGAVGQVSIVNTFCHIHTPLAVSLLRTFNGLWIGALVGCLSAWVLIKNLRAKPPGGV